MAIAMPTAGFHWAEAANDKLKSLILKQDHQAIIHYQRLGREANLAIPTPDLYFPLLYMLGMQIKTDQVRIFNDQSVMGSSR